MLSAQEQKAWDDVQRFWAEDAEDPRHPRQVAAILRTSTPRNLDDAPALVIGGIWAAIFLVLLGAHVAGLAVAAAAVSGLALWRYRPLLWRDDSAASGRRPEAGPTPDQAPRPRAG
jgi:hypothetical protein